MKISGEFLVNFWWKYPCEIPGEASCEISGEVLSEKFLVKPFGMSDTTRVIEKFDGDNFNLWKFKMQMVLEERDMWDIVSGQDVKPDHDHGAWIRKDKKAIATICLSLKDPQLIQVRGCSSANEVWSLLETLYESRDLSSRLFLRRKFVTIKMTAGSSILEHITKVKTLADKLAAIGAPVQEDDFVVTLLSSLPETYDNLVTSLESRADKLTIEFITARLLHEESRRTEYAPIKEETAFYGSRPAGKRLTNQTPRRSCYYCGKTGHIKADCNKRKADLRTAERSNNGECYAHHAGNHQGTEREHDKEHLFAAHNCTTNSSDCWYIDSGASHHVTSRRDWFKSLEDITTRKILMGDNNPHEAVAKGDISIHTSVCGEQSRGLIRDVLYVPGIKTNLLSVSQLTQQGLLVEFLKMKCYIKKDGVVIAEGALERNLYKLSANTTSGGNANLAEDCPTEAGDAILWH